MKTKKAPKKSVQRQQEDAQLYERAMQSGMETGRRQAISVLMNSSFDLFDRGGRDEEAHMLRDYALKIRALGRKPDGECNTAAPEKEPRT